MKKLNKAELVEEILKLGHEATEEELKLIKNADLEEILAKLQEDAATETKEIQTEDEIVLQTVKKSLGEVLRRRIVCQECGHEKVVESNDFDNFPCPNCKTKGSLYTFGVK